VASPRSARSPSWSRSAQFAFGGRPASRGATKEGGSSDQAVLPRAPIRCLIQDSTATVPPTRLRPPPLRRRLDSHRLDGPLVPGYNRPERATRLTRGLARTAGSAKRRLRFLRAFRRSRDKEQIWL